MISLIACMDRNRVIGKDNQMPWHLPADLKHFKATTMGHPIVMGRKTYESIGKPLPGRTNIILTRDKEFVAEGCQIMHSIDDVLALEEDVFVTGGENIFKQFMSAAERMYLTVIDEEFDGDTYFPEINSSWKPIDVKQGVRDEKNPYTYHFFTYKKI